MEYLNKDQIRTQINRLSAARTPFLFLIDFKGERGVVAPLSELDGMGISCSIDGVEIGRKIETTSIHSITDIQKIPIPFSGYQQAYNKVIRAIEHGDSYLLNLTFATRLSGNIDMKSIYEKAKARYKFMVDDELLFYSPEPFLRIEDGVVYSFPMKGTICGTEPNAKEQLLNSEKELYEHYTIVDLIRNDLSMIASQVEVVEFRYVDSIATDRGEILQTSTKISGRLPVDWAQKLGDMLLTLLPAGSVSGAPKERSVQIIEDAETTQRGFYTGIMGVCADGKVDSCVNIRYLERSDGGDFYYRSGGGITAMSNVEQEYNELLTKIYVPTI